MIRRGQRIRSRDEAPTPLRQGLLRPRRWEDLQAQAHLPEIQDLIRKEIFRGTIHVVPTSDGGVRIVPHAERPLAARLVEVFGDDRSRRAEPVGARDW
jgi:hypothetical protein